MISRRLFSTLLGGGAASSVAAASITEPTTSASNMRVEVPLTLYGEVGGRQLTRDEMDGNFRELERRIRESNKRHVI